MNVLDSFRPYGRRSKSLLIALGIAIAWTEMANESCGQILGNLDSANFSYQYEMDVMPSTQDLNGDALNDYTYFVQEGTITASGDGKANIVLPPLTPPQANSYLSAGTEANGIWANVFASGDYQGAPPIAPAVSTPTPAAV